MGVFRNYNSQQAGGVNANAFPRVHPIPWTPTQRNVRANPNIPSQPQRIQPTERGAFFPTSASGGGTLAPAMSSGCSSCGGCSGSGQSQASPDSGATASSIATQHSFPSNPIIARPARGTGMMRSGTSRPTAGTISRNLGLKARASFGTMGGR